MWLSSVEVLKKVLNSKVYNQSKFELYEIKEVIKVYVQNKSYNKALDILKTNRYVIISGIPGIGKTTLARMLVYHLLSKDYDEFVYLSDNIDDAYSIYSENQKQVFFFDDFLGKNFLEIKPRRNEDNKLIKFIETIKKSKNKIFILATREYILNQAKSTFEQLNNPYLDIAKCTLDLSNYTKFIRAEILYNHLYFANVSQKHLQNLIISKKYLKLIEHKNYNPRIIETFVKDKCWDKCKSENFSDSLMDFFENPESVWLHAFENSISKEAQITLIVLASMGNPVLMEDLKDAINSFFIENKTSYNLTIDSFLFTKVIKELENTFIVTKMDSSNKVAIEFQNPSIHDFLINYIKGRSALIKELINSFLFKDQFFNIFTVKKEEKSETSFLKILIKDEMLDLYINKLLSDFNLFKNSTIIRLHFKDSNNFRWHKSDFFLYSFLYKVSYEFRGLKNEKIVEFINKKFLKNINPQVDNYSERSAYIQLFDDLDKFDLEINYSEIISSFGKQVDSVEALNQFVELGENSKSEFEEFVNEDSFQNKIDEIIESEIEYTDEYEYDNLAHDIERIENSFGFDSGTRIDDLRVKYSEHMDAADAQAEAEMEDYKIQEHEYHEKLEREDNMITDLFTSLIE